MCRSGGKSQEITINPRYWAIWKASAVYSSQEQLIFHELAHCLMGRGHIQVSVPLINSFGNQDGVQSGSIMNPSHIRVIYAYNWNDYIAELFTGLIPQFVKYYGNPDFPKEVYDQEPAPLRKLAKTSSSQNSEFTEYKTTGSIVDGEIIFDDCSH